MAGIRSETESEENQDQSVAWHATDSDEVVSRLETGPDGLSSDEAERRLSQYGPNSIEDTEQRSALSVLISQFRSPLIYILLIATAATIVLQEYIDSAVIAAVLILNAIIGFTQERKAEASVQSLRKLVSPKATVVRDGTTSVIESEHLVPGDLVVFESGTSVPADVRLTKTTSLQANESLLTGESTAVWKSIDAIDSSAGVADRTNMLHSGTTVTSGRGRGYVVATGSQTQIGDIAEQIRSTALTTTPLQARMDRFAKTVGVAVLGLTVIAFILGIATGVSAREMFMIGVGLAVATVPEGLPIVFTVTLAIGVHRMAQQNAIIRKLPAVETMGSASVIGSDKTGTLTENRMTAEVIWTPGGEYQLSADQRGQDEQDEQGLPEDLQSARALLRTLETGVLANEATLEKENGDLQPHGDPTETALLAAAADAGIDPFDLREKHPVVAEIPFEPERKYSASVHKFDGTVRQYVKGAPERILEMCTTMEGDDGVVEIDSNEVERAAEAMAARGLRVLATGYVEPDALPRESNGLDEPSGLTLTGLIGLMDPPRDGVREAIKGCQDAGIRIVMITGDHARTATAIARDIGIGDGGEQEALTGAEIESMSDEDLQAAIKHKTVFARVSPDHKRRITEAFRNDGAIIGVTGDGVNDAPALKAAHIGIAMGKSGTDVAREASDMVLADDNFVSIYAAVEQGRITFDNVRKVTFFLISTAISLPLTILSALILGWPLPFVPAQLLWLNLVTNGLQDVALAFEPGEPDTLKRKPRPWNEGIVSSLLWERSAITGIVLTTGTLMMFWWELSRSDSIVQAQSVALTTMVMFQMVHVLNARSDNRSVFRISPISNPFLLAAMVAAFVIHLGAMYFGPAQAILRIEPISFDAWLYIVPMALSIIVIVELHKLIRRQKTTV